MHVISSDVKSDKITTPFTSQKNTQGSIFKFWGSITRPLPQAIISMIYFLSQSHLATPLPYTFSTVTFLFLTVILITLSFPDSINLKEDALQPKDNDFIWFTHSSFRNTGIPYFIALHFIVLSKCCNFFPPQNEIWWQLCIEQIYWYCFSNSFCSFCVWLHFGNLIILRNISSLLYLLWWSLTSESSFFIFYFYFLLFSASFMVYGNSQAKLGVEELEIPLLAAAIAMWDPSCICDLHHSSRCWIPNPLSKARVKPASSWIWPVIHDITTMTHWRVRWWLAIFSNKHF